MSDDHEEETAVDRLYDRSKGLMDALDETLIGRPASVAFFAISASASVKAGIEVHEKTGRGLDAVAMISSIEQAELFVQTCLGSRSDWHCEPLLLARFLTDALGRVAVRLHEREERERKCEK